MVFPEKTDGLRGQFRRLSKPLYGKECFSIDETVERLEKGVSTVVFWIFWIIGTGVIVFKFYERENEWLE